MQDLLVLGFIYVELIIKDIKFRKLKEVCLRKYSVWPS